MRVTIAQIRSLGLDWPADRTDPDGSVDLDALIGRVDTAYESAEMRELGDHAAVVRALLRAIGDRSIGVGPIPRTTIDALALPCSPLLLEKLVTVEDDEVDLVKTMDLLVRNYRYYRREYDGLNEQRRRYNAPKHEISDRWDELSSGMYDNEAAIGQLSAILAAVCK